METNQKSSIEQLGKEGEEKARIMLKELGFLLTKPDWIGEKNGEFIQFEIKMKSQAFTPPPFLGHGLDIYQIERRKALQKKHNLKCMVIIFEKDSPNIYYQWLDKLEEGSKFDTRRGIRIYPIEAYCKRK